jgi:uridine kinase
LTYPLIVIIESIYLFQKSIIPYLNYKIFLDISINEALKRAQSRKRDLNLYNGSTGVEKKYSMKNFPGYIQFEKEEDPKQYADVIIDNNNWKNPVVVRG